MGDPTLRNESYHESHFLLQRVGYLGPLYSHRDCSPCAIVSCRHPTVWGKHFHSFYFTAYLSNIGCCMVLQASELGAFTRLDVRVLGSRSNIAGSRASTLPLLASISIWIYYNNQVHVANKPGVYTNVDVLDFGTLRTMDEPKSLSLNLMNYGNKSVRLLSIQVSVKMNIHKKLWGGFVSPKRH